MSSINTDQLQGLGVAGQPSAKRKDQLGQEDFLKLMTAQLANQDPFKPMESGEFMTQIAQFSASQGIQDLQKSFDGFAGSMTSSQALQATSLVGRRVIAASDENFLADGSMRGTADLPYAASEVKVNIYDKNGELVRRFSLGEQSAGLIDYEWDGMNDDGKLVEAGIYDVEIEATIGGTNYQLTNLTETTVDSVTFRPGGGMKVTLAGLGDADLSQLREIR